MLPAYSDREKYPEFFRETWMGKAFVSFLKRIPFIIATLAFLGVLYDFGFNQTPENQRLLDGFLVFALCSQLVFILLRYLLHQIRHHFKVWAFDLVFGISIVITILVVPGWMKSSFFASHYWIAFLFLLIFLRELSAVRIEFRRRFVNPAQLFMFSFMLIILLGALVLMFPNATRGGISFVDALFTSTSAVCVTGLSSVDTGTTFTSFGLVALMALIQIGGLGIMTFTSYFSYFFTGESSYENQLIIQEMTNSDKISDVFGTLKRVILLTFSIEAIGALCIYHSLNPELLPGIGQRIFFSVFHAVSGFCNAGFSPLANNLYEVGYRFNYPFHLTIAFLIILGGIGFPILFNFAQYLKHLVHDQLFSRKKLHRPWVINLNTRIVFITTLVLLVVGTGLFYWLEYDNTLAEHGPFGKIVTAFFGAVTPRTAGFSTIDIAQLHMSTVYLICFLMWVGASPASTGGGIKTSTLAISILNALNLARGKNRIECFGREISESSVRRASTQIFLSLITLGVAVVLVTHFDPGLPHHSILFECISAFGTVGLTLGITMKLTAASKLVLVVTMFIGRVSLLTILAAFMKQVRFLKYQYPTEDITIN